MEKPRASARISQISWKKTAPSIMANVGILPYFIIDLNVKYLPASFPNTAISDTDLGLLTEVLIGGWPRVSLISKHWTQDMIYLHMHYDFKKRVFNLISKYFIQSFWVGWKQWNRLIMEAMSYLFHWWKIWFKINCFLALLSD